jgi:uncharacterized protein (TIGR00255 family)
MTGFGAATRVIMIDGAPQVLGVELRSVNQRFLEIKARQPFGLATEQEMRRRIEARLGRGRVDLLVHLQPQGGTGIEVDVSRFAPVLIQLRELTALARETGLEIVAPNPLDILRFVTGQRAVSTAALEAPQEAPPELWLVMDEALAALAGMREREGAALVEVLGALATDLAQHGEALRTSLSGEAERLQDRLIEKITALCARAGVSPPSPERVAQEVAVLVQRGDIEEELARLASHLAQVWGVLTAPAQVGQGKTLDFLSQELFREITTIGSKITSHAGSAAVIAAKATIERMREQVQNVE